MTLFQETYATGKCELYNCSTIINECNKAICGFKNCNANFSTSSKFSITENNYALEKFSFLLEMLSASGWTYLALRPIILNSIQNCKCINESSTNNEITLWDKFLSNEVVSFVATGVSFFSLLKGWAGPAIS